MKPKQRELGLDLSHRRTHKAVVLDEMEPVVPWAGCWPGLTPCTPGQDGSTCV